MSMMFKTSANQLIRVLIPEELRKKINQPKTKEKRLGKRIKQEKIGGKRKADGRNEEVKREKKEDFGLVLS